MKIAASIFSWIGGVLTTIIGFINLNRGQIVTRFNYATGHSYTEHVPYETWLWILWWIFVIVRLIILIWRQSSVNKGYKVACGICTLIFCSLIGGILTLCIPQYQLDGDYYASSYTSTPVPPVTPLLKKDSFEDNMVKPADIVETLSEQEKADLILKYKKMLDDGIITQEEFERKKKDLLK